jgi:hypothetical protein
VRFDRTRDRDKFDIATSSIISEVEGLSYGYSRKRQDSKDDFPEPVRPITATEVRGGITNETSCSDFFFEPGYVILNSEKATLPLNDHKKLLEAESDNDYLEGH